MPDRTNALGLLYRLAPGLNTLAHYRPAWLSADLAAGLSVAAVALPVGIAYAELARVPAVIGMYAAIFPLFAYALFGTSRQLMVGPDAATCMMMAAAIAPLAGGDPERYLALVVVMTLSVGLVYLAMGVFRLGFIANFLSLPILVGFLNGIGVLVLGVLPGVLLAIILSLLMMLMLASKPTVSVLGKVPGMKGHHSLKDYPEARTIPGLLLFRFSANLVFYNVDYFKSRLLAAIDAAETPVEWVVLDASPINVVDSTALKKVEALIESLESRGITVAVAARRHAVGRLFDESWLDARRELVDKYSYPTISAALKAFERRGRV